MAGIIVKAAVSHEVDGLREANVNREAPLDGNLNQPLAGRSAKGLVSGINHWVHKGSVIDADWTKGGNPEIVDLVKKIKVDMSKPGVPLNQLPREDGTVAVDGGAQDEAEPKVIVKPITLEDFEAMIGTKKGGLGKVNKGYVRFAKTADGGLKLEKVGNKCGCFINSRINVTPEHNRQMRMLFADALLADWGGADAFEIDKHKYGSKIADTLGTLRSNIIKGSAQKDNPGGFLSRAEIKTVIDQYKALFAEEGLVNIAETFLGSCFDALEFTMPGKDKPTLDDFMAKYGAKADEGFRTKADLENLIKGCASAKDLRAAMEKIADQFTKMDKYWQTDRETNTALDQLNQSLTTGRKLYTDKQRGLIGGVLLEHLKTIPGIKDASAEKVTRFVDKILPLFAKSVRFDYQNTVSNLMDDKQLTEEERNTRLAQAEADFKAKLDLDSVKKEAEAFFKAFDDFKTKMANPDDPAAYIKAVFQARKDGLVLAFNEKCQRNPNMSEEDYNAEADQVEAEIRKIGEQLKFLEAPGKILDDRLAEIAQTSEDKFVLLDAFDEKGNLRPQKTQGWTKDELNAVCAEYMDSAKTQFGDEFFMLQYAGDKYKSAFTPLKYGEFAGEVPLLEAELPVVDCKEMLTNIVDSLQKQLDQALAINLVDKKDISLGEFCGSMADVLLESNIRGDLKCKTFTVDCAGRRQGSVQITVERLMKLFVDKAVEQKLANSTRYEDSRDAMTAKFNTLLGILHKRVSMFDPKDTKELSRFYRDVRGFSRVDAISEAKLYGEKGEFAEGLTRAVQIKMLETFLDKDLGKMLDWPADENEAFAKEVDATLKMRFSEAIEDERAKTVHTFYEGTLNFRTGNVTDSSRKEASLDANVKDADTGFTNVRRVEDAFLGKVQSFQISDKIADRQSKVEYHPIQLDQLKGKLLGKAQTVWEDEVVHNAPGRGFSDSIDWIIYKFKKTFDMNRFVDITDKWVASRANSFENKLAKMTERYFTFEQKFVDVCRQRVEQALLATKDPRVANLAAMRDPEMRALLLNDVLAGFQPEMEAVLTRFIKTPAAFDPVVKNGTAFARFVDDALGLLPRGDVKLENTAGYKTLTDALSTTLEARLNNIANWTWKKDSSGLKTTNTLGQDLATIVMTKLGNSPYIPEDQKEFLTNLLEANAFQQYGKDLLTWAVDHMCADVEAHPLDFYRNTKEEFLQDLAGRLLADMTSRFAGFAGKDVLGAFLEQFGEGGSGTSEGTALVGDYEKEFENSPTLLNLLGNEEKLAMRNFAANYGSIDRKAFANSTRREEAVTNAINNTIAHFKNILECAKVAQQEKIDTSFERLLTGYNATLSACEQKLRDAGVLPNAVDLFRLKADALFKSRNDELSALVKSEQITHEELTKQVALTVDRLRSEVEVLTGKAIELLRAQHALLTEEVVGELFASMGAESGKIGYSDPVAFKEAVQDTAAEFKYDQDRAMQIDMYQYAYLTYIDDDAELAAAPTYNKGMEAIHLLDRFAEIYQTKAVEHAKQAVVERTLAELHSLSSVDSLTPEEIEKLEADVRNKALAQFSACEKANDADIRDLDKELGKTNEKYNNVYAKIRDFQGGNVQGKTLDDLKKELAKHTKDMDDSKNKRVVLFNRENFELKMDEIQTVIKDELKEIEQEHARVQWLDANKTKILEAILDKENPEFVLTGEMGESQRFLATTVRATLTSDIEKYLREGVLAEGTPEDWNKILNGEGRVSEKLGDNVADLLARQKEVVEQGKDMDVTQAKISAGETRISNQKSALVDALQKWMVRKANIVTTTSGFGRWKKTTTTDASDVLMRKAQEKLWNVATPKDILATYQSVIDAARSANDKASKEKLGKAPKIGGEVIDAKALTERMAAHIDKIANQQISQWIGMMTESKEHDVPKACQNEKNLDAVAEATLAQDRVVFQSSDQKGGAVTTAEAIPADFVAVCKFLRENG